MAKPLPNITLSAQQQEAIDKSKLWFKFYGHPKNERAQIFYIAGYAGTGKSTIVPFIIHELGLKSDDVCFATYTAQAARVLSSKLHRSVSTIHSLCYELVDDYIDPATNKVVMAWKIRKKSPLKTAKLLVLDEVSMVNKDMMKDLMSFGVMILVLGDPFQIKPVEGDAYFHEGYSPDIFLTEIHRQALENPIIWLSKRVREGHNIDFGHYGETVTKMMADEVPYELWLQADQTIVGTNKTRRNLNRWFRQEKGFEEINSVFPVKGDKLICLKNRVDDGLVNGMLLKATSDARVARDRESFTLNFEALDDAASGKYTQIICSSSEILGTKLAMPYHQQKKLLTIDYGYVITCHKAQGSQFDDVIFVDEGFGKWLTDNTYQRHLYTAMTRAAKRLIIAAK